MNDQTNNDQSPCCDGGECCSSAAPAGGDRKRRWRIIVFSGVILLATAVAAYSLFWRSAATSACCPPGSAAAAACGQAAGSGFDHATAPFGLSLVVLLNEGAALSGEQMAVIGEVRAAVESRGAQLQFDVLHSGDTAFLKLVDQYRIAAFPAMVVTGQDSVLMLGNDRIRADAILSVFKPGSATCAPDSASANRSL